MAAPLEAAICYFSHCFPLGRLVFVTPCWDVDGPPDLMIIFLWNSPLPLLFIEPESSWIYMIVCIWSLHAYHQADTHIIHIGVTDVVTKIKQPSDQNVIIIGIYTVLQSSILLPVQPAVESQVYGNNSDLPPKGIDQL